jgi:anti-sigma regulatory factor (Ser/Thr protein kinase)
MATGPTIRKRETRRIAAGDMSARARRIITATMTNLGSGEVLRTETFPAAEDQVARMRKVLKETVADHPACGTVILLASELATNSIRYSGSRFFGLTIARIEHDGLRVAVIDEGRAGFPCLQNESLDAERGRGMRIVDMMAHRWGITRQADTGVAVWFECMH